MPWTTTAIVSQLELRVVEVGMMVLTAKVVRDSE